MAHSPPSDLLRLARRLAWVLPCLVTGLVLTSAAASAETERCTEDIVVNGDGVDANYRTNNIQLRNVVISQCDIRVEARHAQANGLDFENSRWTFDGDVRIDVEKRGSLRSDQAQVDFRNSQISKATITGKPAEFEQKRADSDAMTHGRAGEIVYDVGAGTVTLSNDAWVNYGGLDVKSARIVYDIREQRALSTSVPGAGERVQMTITPKKASRSGAQKPAGETPSPAPNTTPPPSPSPKTP